MSPPLFIASSLAARRQFIVDLGLWEQLRARVAAAAKFQGCLAEVEALREAVLCKKCTACVARALKGNVNLHTVEWKLSGVKLAYN